MQVKRFADAKAYDAPNHRGCLPLRLFGAEAGGTQTLIVGLSHFLPGGGAVFQHKQLAFSRKGFLGNWPRFVLG